MYSRVRASGFANGIPYQPSTTCGPDTPSPRMKRPPERWSIVIAAIAVAAGWRADICTIAVPSLMRSVVRAPPGERREAVGAVRLGGPDRVEAEPLGLGDRLDDAGRRAAGPVAGVQSELQVAGHGRSSIGSGGVRSPACPQASTRSMSHRSARSSTWCKPRSAPPGRRPTPWSASGRGSPSCSPIPTGCPPPTRSRRPRAGWEGASASGRSTAPPTARSRCSAWWSRRRPRRRCTTISPGGSWACTAAPRTRRSSRARTASCG